MTNTTSETTSADIVDEVIDHLSRALQEMEEASEVWDSIDEADPDDSVNYPLRKAMDLLAQALQEADEYRRSL